MMRLALSLSIVLNIGARPIAERGCDQLGEPSADIHARIEEGREMQRQRFAGMMGGAKGNVPVLCNADKGPAEVREHCRLDDSSKSLLCAAMSQLGMVPAPSTAFLRFARDKP